MYRSFLILQTAVAIVSPVWYFVPRTRWPSRQQRWAPKRTDPSRGCATCRIGFSSYGTGSVHICRRPSVNLVPRKTKRAYACLPSAGWTWGGRCHTRTTITSGAAQTAVRIPPWWRRGLAQEYSSPERDRKRKHFKFWHIHSDQYKMAVICAFLGGNKVPFLTVVMDFFFLCLFPKQI